MTILMRLDHTLKSGELWYIPTLKTTTTTQCHRSVLNELKDVHDILFLVRKKNPTLMIWNPYSFPMATVANNHKICFKGRKVAFLQF